ncbi:MAG: hypothetical protein WAK20_22170 [Candidatus Acidiferrum sp.]
MKKKSLVIGGAFLAIALLLGLLAYQHWFSGAPAGVRAAILSALPDDPSTVVFLDLGQFRSSAFLPQLLNWAPSIPAEEDYLRFVQATGFNYETDLDLVAISFTHDGSNSSTTFAVAQGRFDRKKIEAYAAQTGERLSQGGKTVFALNLKNSTRKSFFSFLQDDRIAWTNNPAYATLFNEPGHSADKARWAEQFARLGGTSVFAVIRQDATTAQALVQQAPNGFRSPQLASLLAQLEWITVGGKPEGKDLRVVMEGQSSTESTIRQLKEFLGGILILAQAGLNGPVNRKQLDPQLREGYLNLLKSAEVESVDRGADKSVRVMFLITPALLDALGKANAGH